MTTKYSLQELTTTLSRVEDLGRVVAEHETLAKAKQRSDEELQQKQCAAEREKARRLDVAMDQIKAAVISELKKAGLDIPPIEISEGSVVSSKPGVADLMSVVEEAGKGAVLLEASLRELEHHRNLEAKAASVIEKLKSRSPSPSAPRPHPQPQAQPANPAPTRLITVPPPSPPVTSPTPPAKSAALALWSVVAVLIVLVLGLILFILFRK
jgi:hypothetical protein